MNMVTETPIISAKSIRRTLGAMLVCLLACMASSALASPVANIALKKTATIDGALVQLGDIADIQCAEQGKYAKLSKVVIKKAPTAGKSTVIRKEQIFSKLRAFGLTPSDYHLTHSGSVKVMRRSVTVSAQTICRAVKEYIESHSPWTSDQLAIKKIRFNQALHVPPGAMHIQVQAPKHTDWLGPVAFTVTVWVRNHLVKKITVPATLEVWSNVIVAAKPMGRGQPIKPGSVKTVRMNLARAPSNALLSIEHVLGKRMTRSVAVNTVLRSDQIEIPPAIKRGDVVQVIAQSKALRIALKGVAKENGAIGDRIRIQNMRSKRMIYAMVLDDQTVQVDY